MKKYFSNTALLLMCTLILSSCNNQENSKTQEIETEDTALVEEPKVEQQELRETEQPISEAPVTNNPKMNVSQMESDARRMAELSCQAQMNIKLGQQAGLSKEAIKAENDPLNAEMTQISLRFNSDYAKNGQKEAFQKILQETLKECMK
jgi:hypothetical protein